MGISVRVRHWRCGAVIALLAWLSALPLAALLPERPIDFAQVRDAFSPVAVIAEGRAACYRLDTLLAASPEQRARGLMFVRSMPDDAGMLFYYPVAQTLSMWMKNTLLPLDILFADSDGTVIHIARDTTPLSLDSISSGGPARYVLELNAGVAAALGIDTGRRLHILAAN